MAVGRLPLVALLAVLGSGLGVSGMLCPYGWLLYSQSCYFFAPSVTPKTWSDAQSNCHQQGGNLLQIDSTAERDWVKRTLTNLQKAHSNYRRYWIGLNSKPDGKNWKWATGTAANMGLFNGQWASHQPRTDTHSKQCVEFNSGKLDVQSCGSSFQFICERPKSLPLTCDSDGGWRLLNGMCYKQNNGPQNWNGANSICHRWGARLPVITDSDTQSMLLDFAKTLNYNIWTGIHAVKSGSSWSWKYANGSMLTDFKQSYWSKNQPGTNIGGKCVDISKSGSKTQSWTSSACNARRKFVCQKPEGVCPRGWLQYTTHCFKFFPRNTRRSFAQAEALCQQTASSGHLVRFTGANIQVFFNSVLGQERRAGIVSFWIGLTDNNKNGGPWQYSPSGNIGRYTNFYGHPSNTNNKQDCGYIDTNDSRGRWKVSNNCRLSKNVVCQMSVNDHIKVATRPPVRYRCPPHWVSYKDTCLYINQNDKSYLDATQWCQAKSAQLAVIRDSNMNSFVSGKIRNMGDFWIGLTDRAQEGVYVWDATGAKATYTKWAPHQPDNNRHQENCVHIFGIRGASRDGLWNDAVCTAKKNFICQQSGVISHSTPQPTTPRQWSTQCGPLWESAPNSPYCYQFRSTLRTWTDARDECKHVGGDLISIASEQEAYYVAGRISTITAYRWWIGANDRTREGGWAWTDGTPFAFLHWSSGQPAHNKGNEDCGALIIKNTLWVAIDCTERHGFICKKVGKVTPTTPQPTTPPKNIPRGMKWDCPIFWHAFRGSCYKFVLKNATWSDAQQLCRQQHGDLASVGDRAEDRFVYSLLPKNFPGMQAWIGFNDLRVEARFEWTDGVPVTYTHWATGEPNNWFGRDEDCIGLLTKNGAWNDEVCSSQQQGFICKMNKQIVSAHVDPVRQGCAAGLGYRAQCYLFMNTMAKNFQSAERDCVSKGGHLATITDQHIQAFLGAEVLYRPGDYWVGLRNGNDGVYKWTSNYTVSYTSWYEGHTGQEKNSCVYLRTTRPAGLWMNSRCGVKKAYICEVPRKGFTTPKPTPPTTISRATCPAGWYAFRNLCVKAFYFDLPQRQTWDEARTVCGRYGGDLLSIRNNQTETFLLNTVLNGTDGAFWIGLNDRFQEKGYRWSDGKPMLYTNWAPGEPNDYNNREDCVEYIPSENNWNDNNCFISKNFICEVKRGKMILTTPVPPTGVASTTCGTQVNGTWLRYDNYCYYLPDPSGDSALLDWFEARRHCNALAADLVSITTPDENNFITGLLTKQQIFNFWTGLNDLAGSGYQWTDGKPVSFLSWNKNEPNDAFGGEKCVEVYKFGLWNDADCNKQSAYICKRLPSDVTPKVVPPTQTVVGGCPRDFNTLSNLNKCYYVSPIGSPRLNWQKASDACTGKGAKLASINSIREKNFLVTLVKGLNSTVWIGLNDHRLKGVFSWVDNNEITYLNWGKDFPTADESKNPKSGGTLCAMMFTDPVKAGKWRDVNCGWRRYYICEVAKNPNLPVINNVDDMCPSGYKRHNTNCYKLDTTLRTWTSAQANCQRDQANLISIGDIYEQSFAQVFLSTQGIPVWIGLSDTLMKGNYQWADGWPVTYTRWGKNEPSRGVGEGCVLLNKMTRWNDTVCTDQHASICELDMNKVNPPTTPVLTGGCPDPSWQTIGDFCYKVETSLFASWPEARYTCNTYGAELASVHSTQEMTTLKNFIGAAPPDLWIGLYKIAGAGFVWTDNGPVNFLNWDDGEPSDPDSSLHQDCVAMMGASSLAWNDVDCFGRKGYVCKVLRSAPTTRPPPLGPISYPGQVPTNYPPASQGPYQPWTQGPYQPQTQRPYQPQTRPHYVPPSIRPFTRPHGPVIVPDHPYTNNPGNWLPPNRNPQGNTIYYPGGNTLRQTATQAPSGSGGGLSGGGVAAVVLAVLVIVVGLLVGGWYLSRRRKFGENPSFGFDNAIYNREEDNVAVASQGQSKMYMSGDMGGGADC